MITSNKKNIRIILVVLLVLISALLTALLNLFPLIRFSSASTNVKKIYFAENITPVHMQLINKFNKINKGKIKVIPIDLPYEKFSTNKRKELITKNLRNRNSRIDIYAIDVVWGERFVKWSEPLNKYFTNDEINRIFDEAKHYCYSDSVLYSIPFFADVGILYYREDLIKKTAHYEDLVKKLNRGITWQELAALKIPGCKYNYLFQADDYEGLMCNFLEIAGRNSFLPSKLNIVEFNKKVLSQRLNYVRDLIYKKKIIPQIVTGFDEIKTFNYALEKNIPLFRGWPTGIKNIRLKKKLVPKTKYLKMAPLPHFEGTSSVSTIGGWNLIVSKNSNHKKESVKFIKFLISKSSQKLIWEKNRYLPVLKFFYTDSIYLAKYPELKLCLKLLKTGAYRIKNPQYTRISDVLTAHLNEYFREKISVDKFINKSLKDIKVIRERYLK